MEVFSYIILLLSSAIFFGNIANRLKQPAIVGQIIGGIIAGPFLAYLLSFTLSKGHYMFDFLSVVYASPKTKDIVNFAGVMLMFGAGLETNPKELLKVGKSAILVAAFGVIFPLFLGYMAGTKILGLTHLGSMYLGVALSITAVALSVTTLLQMNKLNTKEGLTIVGAAIVDDIIGVILLSVLMAIKQGSYISISGITITIIFALLFVAISIFISPTICKWIFKFIRMVKSEDHLAFVLLWIFIYSVIAHFLKIHLIIGAYLGGLSIREVLRPGEKDILKNWIWGFFAPLFFAWTGFSVVFNKEAIGFTLIVILIIAFLGKVLGGGFGAFVSGFPIKSSIEIGIGMNGRAAVELIVANVALTAGLINRNIYSSIVFMAVVMALLTPILLKWYIKTFITKQNASHLKTF